MNREKKSMLIALCIGDGYLNVYRYNDKSRPNSWHQKIRITHSVKQRDYLVYKTKLLQNALGCGEIAIREFNNNGYPGVSVEKSHRYFRYLKNLLYVDGKKNLSRRVLNFLTPHGLALWYQDDGCLSLLRRNGKIHARRIFLNTCITQEENQVIIDYFFECWGVRFNQVMNNGSYRLSCGTIEAKKFVDIVEPYIHPSMFYKIDFKYS